MDILQGSDRILSTVEWVFFQFIKLSLVIMALLTTADALGRYFLNSPIYGARDVTAKLLMIVLVYWALAPLFASDDHVRLTFLYKKCSPLSQFLLELVFDGLAFVFFGLIAVQYGTSFLARYDVGIQSVPGVTVPQIFPDLIIFIGCLLLCLRLLIHAARQLRSIYQLRDQKVPNMPLDGSQVDE